MAGFWRGALVVAATLLVAACDSGSQVATGVSRDLEAAAQLYEGTQRTPPGFLADPAPSSFLQVTTYHLKSTQIDPLAMPTHELCSDDWSEALAWSEQQAQQAPSYLDLVGNEQSARYFEFDRVPRDEPERYVRMRVFRCDYLDRSGVDLSAASSFAGTLHFRPVDATALGELSEYLWHFTIYNNADHVVLASSARGATPNLSHVITIASLQRAATVTSCDRVILREWQHAVDEITGALSVSDTTLREFTVRREGGMAVPC